MPARFFSILTFLLAFLGLQFHAAGASPTDQNKWPAGQVPLGQTNGSDGLDDIWQEKFNAWGIAPGADSDNDGLINSLEAVAGTNPFVATDRFKIGNMTIVGNAVEFRSKVEAGKKYRVLSADMPNGPVWAAVTLQSPVPGTTEYIPSADLAEASIYIQSPGNTKKFYKLETSDVSTSPDGVSDWAKRKLGLVPGQADSNGDGVSDMAEINQALQSADVIRVEAENAFASEDGGPAGLLRLRRNNSLMGARIYYTLGGNATAGTDFAALSGFVDFAPGAKTATIAISPTIDAALEGGEAVTVTLNGGMIGNSTPVVIDENKKQATVIISNTTAPSGTGLLARYYDHSNGTYEHAANFGDAANYQYTRAGTTPNFTGTAVITPTGVSPARLATLLAALTPNTTQVRFSFNGGNLSTAVYNNQNFLVTAKTAATFTIALPPGAGLPTTSTSTCNFSIQPIHPGLIERVEAVNNDWIYGTPNFTTISHLNSPDNYSETFETYLAPTTAGNYRFQLDADDKARVLIDLNLNGTFDLPGEQVVEHGWDTAATGSPEDGTADNEIVGTFKITPVGTPYALAIPGSPTQRYKMRVEHVDASGDARCRLQWNIDGGAFANIPQANQFTHTQAMTWSYTAGNLVVTPTGGHSRSVGQNVDLSFSSGPLFRPGATSTHNGTLPISAVNGTTTFTVAIPQTTVTLTGATTTAGSATVGVSSVAGLYVGMSITGTGLPANEFITAIGTNSITITTGTGVTAQLSTDLTCRLGGIPVSIAGASTTAGSQTVLVPSIDGLATGMSITGPGLPTNATISAIGPGMILLSTATGVTTQASTTLTAFLHPTSNVTGNGFVLNNTASTTIGVYNLIYPNTTFSGSPGRVGTFNQVTEQNNGIWGTGTPDAALINPDTFSVRWSGQVQPQFTEEYTFIVQADDGCTLKLNGQVQALKTLPGTNNDGSNYHYDSTTGTILVNYVNARIKPGSFVAGETIRIDPASGNLTQANGSTYTYDAATGVAIVNYSNLTTNTPGGFIAGQIVELDPTSGTANTLANLRYTILSNPTANTFTVDFGINAFASETAGTATINVTDNRDIVVASVFPAGNASYTYASATGVTVVDYATAGLLANTLTTGMQVVLDPTGGNLTNEIYTYKTITAHTATTFTVSYATGLGNSTGSMLFMAPGLTSVPAAQTTAMALTHYAGRHAANSVGNINLEIVNKPLKDWSSMGNERYVRFPVVGGTRYDIQLDYYESTGNARAQLYWQSASQPKQIIPTERLYPENIPQAPPVHLADTTATALVGGPFSYAVLGSNAGAVTVSGLPAGLSYLNGFISGTATTAGDYQILISITNAAGTSTSVLNLHVEAAGGNLVRELWSSIAGTSISSIPLSTAPSSTSNLSSLQAPVDAADDFGARMRGYITAPTTGNYYFWLNASDSAEFWLSNDDETINSFKRATVTGGVTAKSPWMALEQGKRYYFEILHKAGVGSDNLSLGWSKPGEATTAASEVVPGYVITNYVPPAPGSTPGTLYIATMLSQGGAITTGVGTATMRLSEDETVAYVTFNHSGLTGLLTDWHVHNDPFLNAPAGIIFDGVEPVTPGDGLVLSGPYAGSHKWTILGVGALTAADVRELIKQGKSYINLHTTAYPNGEIRGNYTLANGSRTFSPPPAPPTWTDDSNTDVGAARFLTQASFGPNIADIAALKALTATSSSGQYPASRYETWIDAQFLQIASQTLPEVLRTRRADAQGGSQLDEALFFNAWWRNSISNADQLRQRIAFAMSEIHVISGQGPLDNRGEAIAFFYDKLNEASFGNFRDILETTTLTPAMGRYLDMKNNDKPDPATGRIPNENYAREIKQLFAVGLYRMWPDGTLMLTSKDTPIDTYTQREIVGFSHVFTGWTDGYTGAYRTSLNAPANWMGLMREVPARHYTGPKRVLNNEVLPGLPTLGGQLLDPLATHNTTHFNQSAYEQLAGQELELSHQQLFDHPNTGPFICRQLIQRLVTSHPSRDYLYRVVQKFNNRGDGVRGDMQAVIKAILLDYEARNAGEITKPAFGKQREPLLRVAAAGRAFRPGTFAGNYSQTGTRTITIDLTPAGTAHKLANGNNVLLEFTPATGVAPWTGTYGITSVDTDSFTVQATNYATGTYSIPANSTVCTVSMGGHWLQSGNQVFMDFTSGPASGTAIDDLVYTITHSETANNGDNGNAFTIPVVGTSATARTGNCMIPRFRPGSMTIATSGLAAPNDRRVTMRTEEDHHLAVGNQVQLNIYGIQTLPQPADLIVTVDTVVDLKTYTFLISSAISGWNTSQGNNSVYQFPLLSQPLNRTGTINSRSSTYQLGNTDGTLEQSPINADTVFNYFLPDYKFPGSLASQGITTPEFQLTAETTTVRQANFLYDGVFNPGTTNGYSSFSAGNNAVSMDYSHWITGNATASLGLGAAPTTTVPWTHNQNIATLINHMSMLLTSDQLSTATKSRIRNFVSQPITSITTGNPCTVNTNGPHGYATGQSVCISGVAGGTFSVSVNSNSTARVITVVDADTFTMTGVNCTVAPSAGNLANAHASQVIYDQGNANPGADQRRDRFRAILHLILTSPDFTIQR
ncbi:MAG: DUF1800 family protein [Verrucomicrobiota bacterium]|nr:DUF1800 family protein [Verrucomicrobiota bacterium]